jgi:hypothetical protein
MSNPFFGKRLSIDVSKLRTKLGEAQLEELAASLGVRKEMLRRFEDGDWGEISLSALFFLTALAEEHKLHPLIRTVPSPIWNTFRQNPKQNRILIGSDLQGHVVPADMKCAEAIAASDFRVKAPQSVTEKDADSIRHWMKTGNVICVGGSKVNHATEVALSIFASGAGPKVKFLWPGYARETPVSGASPSLNRIVEINGERFEEDIGGGRSLGIIAVCIDPLESSGCTTIVICGCSQRATELMLGHLSNPGFYRLYHANWEKELAGLPIVFLFDSAAKTPWQVIGAQKPRRKPGRRSGQKNSWPKRI